MFFHQLTPVSSRRRRRTQTSWASTCRPSDTHSSTPASRASSSPAAPSTGRADPTGPGPGKCPCVEVTSSTHTHGRSVQFCALQLFCLSCGGRRRLVWMWEVVCEMCLVGAVMCVLVCFSRLENIGKSPNTCSRNSESQSQR